MPRDKSLQEGHRQLQRARQQLQELQEHFSQFAAQVELERTAARARVQLLQAQAPRSAGTLPVGAAGEVPAPAGEDSDGTQEGAMISAALNAILNFWLTCGGGKAGDEAIRDTLFRDRPHGLDAQELANALQQSMGVHMDTLGDTNAVHACSKRLLRRF